MRDPLPNRLRVDSCRRQSFWPCAPVLDCLNWLTWEQDGSLASCKTCPNAIFGTAAGKGDPKGLLRLLGASSPFALGPS